MLPRISPMKYMLVCTGKFSNSELSSFANPRMPTPVPTPKNTRNTIFRKMALIPEMASVSRSYIPNTTSIVPPETPGITLATPKIIPQSSIFM